MYERSELYIGYYLIENVIENDHYNVIENDHYNVIENDHYNVLFECPIERYHSLHNLDQITTTYDWMVAIQPFCKGRK